MIQVSFIQFCDIEILANFEQNQEKQSTVNTRKINFKFSQIFVKKMTNFFVKKILGFVFISNNKNKLNKREF